MLDIKLEDAIKKALEGKCFGNNKVIVETNTLGEVFVSEYEEDDGSEEYIEVLIEEIADLERKVEKLEEELEEKN